MSKKDEREFSKISNPDIDENATEENDLIDQTQNIIQKYGTTITIVSVVIIVIVGAFIYFSKREAKKVQEATIQLSRVQEIYENGQYEKALNGDPTLTVRGEQVLGLIDIANNYSSTEQGKLASLYAGNSYLSLNDYDNAKAFFEKATDSESKLTRRGANAGIAACLEHNKEYEEAASHYEKAANLSFENEIKYRYMLFAGINYENAGKKDDAVKLYKDIVLMSEKSQYADDAKIGLARLGTVIE